MKNGEFFARNRPGRHHPHHASGSFICRESSSVYSRVMAIMAIMATVFSGHAGVFNGHNPSRESVGDWFYLPCVSASFAVSASV